MDDVIKELARQVPALVIFAYVILQMQKAHGYAAKESRESYLKHIDSVSTSHNASMSGLIKEHTDARHETREVLRQLADTDRALAIAMQRMADAVAGCPAKVSGMTIGPIKPQNT